MTKKQRGGRREGAGRKPIPDQRKHPVTVWLSPEERKVCEQLGESVQGGIKHLIEKETSTVSTFFGFAIADSMFPAECNVSRKTLTVDEVRGKLPTAQMCVNPSHKPTIDAAVQKFGLAITVPEKAPMVALKSGDSVIVMSVRGLPRLEGRHEYTADEIDKATFMFGEWTVQ